MPRLVYRNLGTHQSVVNRIITDTLALTAGTRLGVYNVIAQIGQGGMGQVWRRTTRS